MAGYNHSEGMSNNAVRAYNQGMFTLSKLTKSMLDDAGLGNITVAFAKWLAAEKIWEPTEYHHTGGTWYNKSDFYDLSELEELIITDFEHIEPKTNLAELQARYTNSKAKSIDKDGVRVEGEFTEWGGSRSHPQVIGHTQFTGTLRGKYIHLDKGGKKLAEGNHIKWRKIEMLTSSDNIEINATGATPLTCIKSEVSEHHDYWEEELWVTTTGQYFLKHINGINEDNIKILTKDQIIEWTINRKNELGDKATITLKFVTNARWEQNSSTKKPARKPELDFGM